MSKPNPKYVRRPRNVNEHGATRNLGPIVSTVPRAAAVLGVDAERLAALVELASLEVWGHHAGGLPVYRWPELVELAAEITGGGNDAGAAS
jgi:hypothetical protein